jgi:hypothetical protein
VAFDLVGPDRGVVADLLDGGAGLLCLDRPLGAGGRLRGLEPGDLGTGLSAGPGIGEGLAGALGESFEVGELPGARAA